MDSVNPVAGQQAPKMPSARDDARRDTFTPPVVPPVCPRERDVLALMAEGRSNGAIAGILVVSERAVEKHVGNMFGKLGLAPSDADHRRVLAVLRYLESSSDRAHIRGIPGRSSGTPSR
jgi:DNA-binding NarL/FixJ family response regulator